MAAQWEKLFALSPHLNARGGYRLTFCAQLFLSEAQKCRSSLPERNSRLVPLGKQDLLKNPQPPLSPPCQSLLTLAAAQTWILGGSTCRRSTPAY